jgi:hypothetical protein
VLFEVLGQTKGRDELREVKPPLAEGIREMCMQALENADAKELAIHSRLNRAKYSQRCAEASSVKED